MTETVVQPEVQQRAGEVIDNPIQLKAKAAKTMIEVLNAHVASLFVLFHQYQKHHWVAQGPQFRDLHLLLEEHYTATQRQADDFAERIVTLGGVPVSSLAGQLQHSYIQEEPEGVLDLRQMLSNDLRANQQILQRLRTDIKRARELGDYGTEHLLKRHLRAQELRTQDLMHLLEHESLDEVLADEQPN
ncbi:ferritin-like domain-containing protein [Kallotenue papyrolyticum]|uniref:ferritin-like domain-containing protein n=1 Tax=Kallotenue papyrolyticum TaxID=1325125 RepID=UPI000478650D|nr:DNA starvation/stationary phase protection protein [Kallotenue papyrolyticum]